MTPQTDDSATATSDRVRVNHMYFGSGKPALEALLAGFERRHPSDSTAEVGVENVRLDVKTGILQGDPPDVWLDWPGANLVSYHDADVLAELNDVWRRGNFAEAFHEGPVDAARVDGDYVAVPLNLQRANGLFYDVERVRSTGVDPTAVDDPSDLLRALETVVDETDAVGMVLPMKNPWPTLQLWETVLLGEFGDDVFADLTAGRAKRHRSAVSETLGLIDEYAGYATDDAYYQSWTEANERFLDGRAAFCYQGDWAAGAYQDRSGFEYGRDWDHVAFPGTEDHYVMVMDAFAVSSDAPNLDAARRLVEYVGSAEGQRLFNANRGSIPPRADVDPDAFAPFFGDQLRDFEAATQLPSVTHGLAVPPEVLIELKAAVSEFVSGDTVESTATKFVEAFERVA